MWIQGRRGNSLVDHRGEKELGCESKVGKGPSMWIPGSGGMDSMEYTLEYSRIWFLAKGRNFIVMIPERGRNSLIHGFLGDEWPTCG